MFGSVAVQKALMGPAVARTLSRVSLAASLSASASVVPAASSSVRPVPTAGAPARAVSNGYLDRKIRQAVNESRKSLLSANNPRVQLAEFLRQKPSLDQRQAALEQYTSKSILEHSPEDAMSLYPVNEALLPEPQRRPIAKELEVTGGYLMVRQPMIDTVAFLREHGNDINLPYPPTKEAGYAPSAKNLGFIYGHRGTGKSATLSYAVEWARHAGWLVIGTSIDEWSKDPLGLIQPSTTRPHTFTQPLYSRQFLERFALENSAVLSSMPLLGDYSAWPWQTAVHPMYDPPVEGADTRAILPFPDADALPRLTKAPETVLDLCTLGAWRTDLATEALYALFWELQHTTEVPVLFAIDNINAMDDNTDFVHPTRFTKLQARRLAGVDALANVIDAPPRRGAVLLASTSQSYPMKNLPEMHDRAGMTIQTKRYTPTELQVMIEHYVVSKATHAEPNLTLLRRTEVATGNVPADVRNFFKLQ